LRQQEKRQGADLAAESFEAMPESGMQNFHRGGPTPTKFFV